MFQLAGSAIQGSAVSLLFCCYGVRRPGPCAGCCSSTNGADLRCQMRFDCSCSAGQNMCGLFQNSRIMMSARCWLEVTLCEDHRSLFRRRAGPPSRSRCRFWTYTERRCSCLTGAVYLNSIRRKTRKYLFTSHCVNSHSETTICGSWRHGRLV